MRLGDNFPRLDSMVLKWTILYMLGKESAPEYFTHCNLSWEIPGRTMDYFLIVSSTNNINFLEELGSETGLRNLRT